MIIVETIPGISYPDKYKTWMGSSTENIESPTMFYVTYNCDPVDCLIFSKVLFPEFFLLDDYVFARVVISPETARKGIGLKGNKNFKEESFNQIYVFDLFAGNKNGIDEDLARDLGRTIAFAWNLSLKNTFPDRNFVVNYMDDEKNYGPIVSFHEIRE